MILNTQSWHARLYRYYFGNRLPNNLCPYFWKLLVSIFLFLGMLSLAILFITGVGYMMYWGIAIFFVDANSRRLHSPEGVTGAMIYVVLIGFATVHYLQNRSTKYKIQKDKKKYILFEFIKAKYNKICPSIKWIIK